MVEALRGRWSLRELLAAVGMAKSSYEYAKGALARGEGPERAAAREAVRAAFEESGGTYGYRRIYAQVSSGAGPDAAIVDVHWKVTQMVIGQRAPITYMVAHHASFSALGLPRGCLTRAGRTAAP